MNPVQLRTQGAQITKRTKHISHSQNLEAQFDLVPLTSCCKSYYSHCKIVPITFLFCVSSQSDEVLTVIKAKAQWPAWQPLNV